ncbi:MAG: Glu-tRNA(Gln) amidotransferase subunit GatE [DPANN group archaeon]|nr:Glu-tRNA(Gln) amidotransferase subunit GatE [DPANN group archaeon]
MDYASLGFRCGLEIHQQLEGKKLFCDCPTIIRKDKPDFRIMRRLRASAGETGEIDQAAVHEQKKQKYFIYQGYDDSTCLVETDEEPPHGLNQEALKTALQVCKLLNAKPVEKLFFMRKTVIDGSNTSGFQRTALLARNGFVEVDGRRIGIPTVCLEEEACQVIERNEEFDVYNLSRLGIPLIEIATDPDITSAEECMAVAARLGMILRSVAGMKRGIGSIRQDVNVSIKGGARTEIKGFQEIRSIPKVIEHEIERQLRSIKKGKKIEKEVRKAEPDMTTSFLRPMPGAARMYPETDVPVIDVSRIKVEAAELLDDKIQRISKTLSIPKELVTKLVKKQIDIEGYAKKYPGVKALFIAETLFNTPKEIRKRFNVEMDVLPHVDEVFARLNEGRIPPAAVIDILVSLGKGEKVDYKKFAVADDAEIEKIVRHVIAKNKDAPVGALMGMAMKELKGKADGRKVMELLKKNREK